MVLQHIRALGVGAEASPHVGSVSALVPQQSALGHGHGLGWGYPPCAPGGPP